MGNKKNSNSISDGVTLTPQTVPAIPEETSTKTVSGFLIEEVDIPKRSGKKGSLHYPIENLTEGSNQSFLVPIVGDVTPVKLKAITASVRTYAYRHDYKVTLRTESNGVRVWRDKATVPATSEATA